MCACRLLCAHNRYQHMHCTPIMVIYHRIAPSSPGMTINDSKGQIKLALYPRHGNRSLYSDSTQMKSTRFFCMNSYQNFHTGKSWASFGTDNILVGLYSFSSIELASNQIAKTSVSYYNTFPFLLWIKLLYVWLCL